MTVVLVFPTVVGSFPLGFSSSDSALAPLDSFTLGLTFPLGLSSESESPSLMSDSLAARLEEVVPAPPFDVDAALSPSPSSTKLMSSGETWALTPRDQAGCLNFVWIVQRPLTNPFKRNVGEHLIHWNAQRIGVMKTKVAASSPISSTAPSREASNRLNRFQKFVSPVLPAGSWLLMVVVLPDNGDVEVDPEEDVDDEDDYEGPRHVGDVASAALQLQPDISPKH